MLRRQIAHEFRLQRPSIYFGLTMCLLGLAISALSPWGDRQISGIFVRDIIFGLVLGLAFPALGVIVPLMIGALMVAEERKREVWDWRLSLPASRTRQWAIKLGVGASLLIPLMLMIVLLFVISAHTEGHSRLNFNAVLIGVPFLFMGLLTFMTAGTWASTFTGDPYKALFLGIPLIGVVAAGMLLGDPLRNFQFIETAVPALLLSAMAVVALFTRLNFRFEACRHHRFLGQNLWFLLAGPVFTFAWMCVLGRIESPFWSPGAFEARGFITGRKELIRGEPRIQPLLCCPYEDGGGVSLFHRAGSNQLIISGAYSFTGGVALDLKTRKRRLTYPASGSVFLGFGEGSDYYLQTSIDAAPWVMKWGAIPMPTKGVIARLAHTAPAPATITTQPEYQPLEALRLPVRARSISRLRDNYFVIELPANKGWVLARLDANGNWEVIGAPDTRYPVISSDCRWFTTIPRMEAFAKEGPQAVRMRSTEGSGEFTLEPMGRRVAVAEQAYGLYPPRAGSPLGMLSYVAPLSHDGRFMPFTRTKSVALPPQCPTPETVEDSQRDDTGFPIKFELLVYDTKTQREIPIYPDRVAPWKDVEHAVKRLGPHTLRNLAGSQLETVYKFEDSPRGPGYVFPPMAWAPGRHRLAILVDGAVTTVDRVPGTEETGADEVRFVSGLHAWLPSRLDSDYVQIAFIDDDHLLAWSSLGVYLVDLVDLVDLGAHGNQ